MANLFISSQAFKLLTDKRDLAKALRVVGNQIKRSAKTLIQESKSGKEYGQHRASAPGESPANFTGKLAASMKVSVKKTTLKVTDVAHYAVMLEAGSKGGGRGPAGASGKSIRKGRERIATTKRVVSPRPYLSTAMGKIDIQGQLDAALSRIIDSRTSYK